MRPSTARNRNLRRALCVAAPVIAVLAAPASASALAPEAAHSPNAEDIRVAYWVMLAVVTLLAVAALGGLLAALVRFRDRRGHAPRRLTAERGALTPVLAGLGVLAAAIFVFGVVMTESARELEPSGPEGLAASGLRVAQVGVSGVPEPEPGSREPAEGAPLEIDVVGQQWLWRFEYPGEREDIAEIFTYNELVVPVDTAVVLNISATDVMHRWFVPALGGQVDAVPGTVNRTWFKADEVGRYPGGTVNRTWFKADEVGRYPGASTFFSGTGFPAMRAWVRVVTADEYEAYVEQLADDLSEAQNAVAQAREEEGS